MNASDAVFPSFPGMRDEAEQLFAALAEGSAGDVGVTREAYGQGEQAALDVIAAYARENGLEAAVDRAANLVLTLPGADGDAPCLSCGSHLDSVPQGGNFDGAAGVVAGALCLARMRREGFTPAQDIRVFAFRCEESAWFGKPYIGSSAMLGRLSASDLEAAHRSGRGALREALARAGADVERIARGLPLVDPAAIGAYLELHIEQGPVLVARERPVAVVTGIRGALRHRSIQCLGEAGHSGAVPRELRKDAVFAAAELLCALDVQWRACLEKGLDLVVTSGMAGTPADRHALTRIPGEFSFSIDIRSQRTADLEAFYEILREQCDAVEQARGVRFVFDDRLYTAPAAISQEWVARLLDKARALGLPPETMPSGAGHDAAVFAGAGVPSAMIFVRNRNGSHNPDEAMDTEDFLAGAELLYQALRDPFLP
ncbi:hydantoinase/carbamoylase family amidase [Desulfocurvus sp. DL9XJH121]